MGLQSIEGLEAVYGSKEANEPLSQTANKIILSDGSAPRLGVAIWKYEKSHQLKPFVRRPRQGNGTSQNRAQQNA